MYLAALPTKWNLERVATQEPASRDRHDRAANHTLFR